MVRDTVLYLKEIWLAVIPRVSPMARAYLFAVIVIKCPHEETANNTLQSVVELSCGFTYDSPQSFERTVNVKQATAAPSACLISTRRGEQTQI